MNAPAGRPDGDSAAVTDATRVVFRRLAMREAGDAWVIGRVDTGDFAAMPPVARRVIALLSGGHTVGQAAEVLRTETGRQVAVGDFVAALDGLGFLQAVDGQARDGPDPVRPSLPWLRPRHLRWLLRPAVPLLTLAVIAAAAGTMMADPALVPRYHDLIWSRHTGIVLAGNAALGWTLVWLHELGHLATARAAGVPARLSLSTRLQFLAAQTDVSGVQAAPRRVRLTVYLAGMAVDLLAASACLLVNGLARPAGLAHQLLSAATLESVLFLPLQFLIFMRTDVYFILQDLAGCASLYADGSAHVRYLARRAWRALRRAGQAPPDPARLLPLRERRAVRAYGWVLLGGTAACIAAAGLVTAPAAVTLLAHAARETAGASPAGRADGATALAVVAGFQIAWLRAWWRRHGSQVRACLQGRQQRVTGGR